MNAVWPCSHDSRKDFAICRISVMNVSDSVGLSGMEVRVWLGHIIPNYGDLDLS